MIENHRARGSMRRFASNKNAWSGTKLLHVISGNMPFSTEAKARCVCESFPFRLIRHSKFKHE